MCPIGPSSNKGKKKKIIFFKGPIKVLARVNFQRDYWFITKKKKKNCDKTGGEYKKFIYKEKVGEGRKSPG